MDFDSLIFPSMPLTHLSFSCWPFEGNKGHVSVMLAPHGKVVPKSVSLEHVSSSIAHSVVSAPKDYQVWGYNSASDVDPVRLDAGNCRYDANSKRPIQFCNLRKSLVNRPVNIVQLRIVSNHGNEHYTCVYRFRVHGDRI